MPEALGSSYEGDQDLQPEETTMEDRMDAVFETDETAEVLTVEYRESVASSVVTIPDSVGSYRDDSGIITIQRRLNREGEYEYTYLEHPYESYPEYQPATDDLIAIFESAVDSRDLPHVDGEPTFRVGRDVLKVGDYFVMVPSLPTEEMYPMLFNPNTQEIIGFRGNFGEEAEYVRERIGPRRRREDRQENARERERAHRNFQWRGMVTITEPYNLANLIEHTTNADYNTLYREYDNWLFNAGPPSNGRTSNYIEEQEYFRVIRAAGLEDYLPEGVELD